LRRNGLFRNNMRLGQKALSSFNMQVFHDCTIDNCDALASI
jgi:hypothetical protein